MQYNVNIPEPVQYKIYALALPFDLRCESGTYIYIYIYIYILMQVMVLHTLSWNSLINKSFIKICITLAYKWPAAGYVTHRAPCGNADS